MAKNMQPILKRCKTLGLSPAVLGYSKSTNRHQKQQFRRKQSEYATQLNEKQKVKFIYGVLEKQFHAYYEEAARKQGVTGENLLQELERRLDNVVYRLGFASTRREARQLVNHGHFTVNGKRVNIPSFQVKLGDVVAICEKSRSSVRIKTILEEQAKRACPKWLEKANDGFEGKVIALPVRDDIDYEVAEHLIVELYSK
ncbi:MAG: 30S ribosomal protein S4 [Clostridiales bacterium]|nr:30S ribosomal protein S4 [Clostridiales bacterium]PWM40624.1 MAG: 30S ribosomal protein S4 [Clostridiales bacterium]